MILKSKEQEFRTLFAEFSKQYLKLENGKEHLEAYAFILSFCPAIFDRHIPAFDETGLDQAFTKADNGG